MTLVDLNAASAVILSWLLTYAIHSTILLGVALISCSLVCRRARVAGPGVEGRPSRPARDRQRAGRLRRDSARRTMADRHRGADAGAYGRGAGRPACATYTPQPPSERASVRPSSPALHRGERVEQPTSPPAISAGVWGQVAPTWPFAAVLSWLTIGAVMLVRFGARVLRLHRTLASGPAVSSDDLRDMVVALGDAGDRASDTAHHERDVCDPPCPSGSTDSVAGAISAATRRRAPARRAGARDSACDPARSGMADPGRDARAGILLPAAEPRRPREALRLSRVSVRRVGRAADALAPGPRQVPLNRRVVGFSGERQDFGGSQHDGSRRLSDRSPRDADPQRACASRTATVGRLAGAAAGRRRDGRPARHS